MTFISKASLVACLLLFVGQADALFQGLCSGAAGATGLLAAADTCACPTGTGATTTDTISTTLTTSSFGNGGSANVNCGSATCGGTITGAVTTGTQSPLNSCDALIQGYALAVGALSTTTVALGSTAVTCPANNYCTGSTTLVTNGLPTSTTAVVRGTADGTTSCPAFTTAASAVTAVAVTRCVVPAGYYIASYTAPSGSTPAAVSVVACPFGSTCAGEAQGWDVVNDLVGGSASGATLTAGYYIPVGSTGAALQVPVSCPANSYCPTTPKLGVVAVQNTDIKSCPTGSTTLGLTGQTAVTACVTSAGYYSAATNDNVATVCPANFYCAGGVAINGNSGSVGCPWATGGSAGDGVVSYSAAGSSLVSQCLIKSGFYQSVVASSHPAALTIAACPSNAACVGGGAYGGGVGTGAATLNNYYVASTTSTAACPANAVCAGNATLASAAMYGIVIPAGYYLSGTTTVSACPTGGNCTGYTIPIAGYTGDGVGVTNLAGYYIATAASYATPTLPVFTACVTGLTCVAGQPASATYAGTISPGYYTTGAYTPALCTANNWCAGGAAGSSTTAAAACPGVSTLAAAVAATAATMNNDISDCVINAPTLAAPLGFYVSAFTANTSATVAACPTTGSDAMLCGVGAATVSALYAGASLAPGFFVDADDPLVPMVCPAGYYCPGGTAWGTVVAPVKCPVGSVTPSALPE